MARLTDLVVDSLAPHRLATFWQDVLDDFSIRPYDNAEIERLAALGLTPETDPAVALDGPQLTIFFQKTETPKTARNRVHMDVRAQNREAEVARLTALGATVRDVHADFTVMLDPEGNEFCVVNL